MKLDGTEKNIDTFLERLSNDLKKEIGKKEDVTIAIYRKIVTEGPQRNIIFLITEEDMLAFSPIWDDYAFFKFPYDNLDFYIKGRIMIYDYTQWIPVWFTPLDTFLFEYRVESSIKVGKEQRKIK